MDRFEYHARLWETQDGILKAARVLTRRHGLDENLVHDLEEAFGAGDKDAWDLALARYLEALVEACM